MIKTFYETFRALSIAFPDRNILAAGDDFFTSQALLDKSERIARWLSDEKLAAGDRIAVWMPNSVDWVAILLAASRLGLAVVSLNTRYKAEELTHMLAHSGARLLFTAERNGTTDNIAILREVERNALSQPGFIFPKVVLSDETADAANVVAMKDVYSRGRLAPDQGPPPGTLQSNLVILYTSGTTSLPKGVQVSESALMNHAAMLAPWVRFGRDDRMLLITPFCGIYGLNALIAVLSIGGLGVLTESNDPDETLDLIERRAVTAVSGTVDVVLRRWDECQRQRPRDLSALKGGVVPVAWLHRDPTQEVPIFEESLGVRIVHAYGMSETCSMIIVGNPDDLQEVRAVVRGWCISPLIETRVVDQQMESDVASGEIGHLLIRGPTLMSGYFKNEAATRETIDKDGWLDTGDFARKYADGSVRYEGRSKDIIKIAGFSLAPAELEQFLCRHPDVQQAQVVGLTLDDGTEVLAAAVIARPGSLLSPDDIKAFCKGKVATYKIPSFVKLVTEFPTTKGANGEKPQRHVLRSMLRDEFLQTM